MVRGGLDRLRVLSERDDAHGHAIVESFIPGSEYAVEGVLDHGAFRLLAIFDKPDALNGPLFEETIYLTPSAAAAATQEQIAEAVAAGARAIGLHHGPIHAECRVRGGDPADVGGIHILEVAARPIGGLCSRALRFIGTNREGDTCISLEEVLLRHALGEDVSPYRREDAASGVMMIPIPKRGTYRGVDGVEAARAVPGVEDVRITAKPDVALVPLPEGKSYLGFIFARAPEPQMVDCALRAAHARLRFTIDRELAVVTRF
jgi:hypothetical protein